MLLNRRDQSFLCLVRVMVDERMCKQLRNAQIGKIINQVIPYKQTIALTLHFPCCVFHICSAT